MCDQKECLRPLRTSPRIEIGTNDAVLGWPALDDFGRVNRTHLRNRRNDAFSQGRLLFRVLLIKVEAVRLPIFMQAQAQIEARLPFQPRDVGHSSGCLGVPVIPVKVNPIRVLTTVSSKAGGVQVECQGGKVASVDKPR